MELAFEQKQRSCLKRTAHLSLAQEQTQELIIPDAMPDAARTLICYADPELQSKTSRAGSLRVTGNLRASCRYADEAGGLQLLTTDVPFTLKLESSDLQELTQSVVRCSVRSADSRLINSRKVLLRISVLVPADGYEPWTEEMRKRIEAASGIKAYDIYGLSEIIGPGVGIECRCQKGMHIFEDHFYPEIINPETGEVLPDGEFGELVLTSLT